MIEWIYPQITQMAQIAINLCNLVVVKWMLDTDIFPKALAADQ